MARKSEYTKEFQDNAVRLVVADGKSYIIAARELGIPATMLRVWVTKWRKDNRVARENSQESFIQELIDLRKEVDQLREDNEILKKAAAYFAKNL